MILAVDPGYAKCGWAVVRPRTGRVLALGVIVTEVDHRVEKSTDRARRISQIARQLRNLAEAHSCTTIAAEQALQYGSAAAVAANLLPWGALAGIAIALSLELVEVPAKLWQHAVMPGVKKIDYDELARQLSTFAGRQVEIDLLSIERPLRTHALDAIGVGLLTALTTSATPIIARGATA